MAIKFAGAGGSGTKTAPKTATKSGVQTNSRYGIGAGQTGEPVQSFWERLLNSVQAGGGPSIPTSYQFAQQMSQQDRMPTAALNFGGSLLNSLANAPTYGSGVGFMNPNPQNYFLPGGQMQSPYIPNSPNYNLMNSFNNQQTQEAPSTLQYTNPQDSSQWLDNAPRQLSLGGNRSAKGQGPTWREWIFGKPTAKPQGASGGSLGGNSWYNYGGGWGRGGGGGGYNPGSYVSNWFNQMINWRI